MNVLAVGTNITDVILDKLRGLRSFLLVDDGPMIDEFISRTRLDYTELDFSRHDDQLPRFNPLSRMNDLRAENFVADLDILILGGDNTLTRKNANHLIYKTLVTMKPKNLDKLFKLLMPLSPKDVEFKDAAQKIERLLLSSVLRRVFTGKPNFTIRGILLARINRAELGDFASRALTYFLIDRYPGQIVIPRFGLYGRKHHASLIEQDRLIAGVNYLSESELEDELLLIEEKIPNFCLYDDAVRLAKYAGLMPDPTRVDNDYNNYIKRAVGVLE